MTSKEAFRVVRWGGVGFTHETFLEATDLLLKDLEILEQYKKIEEQLKELIFYGKVYQLPNKIVELKFFRVYRGMENKTDIRIEFDLLRGGCVFYSIFDYGKTWALTKEELENSTPNTTE